MAACVQEAAVNDEMVARSSRSHCCFVPLRRAYNKSTDAWVLLKRRMGACFTSIARSETRRVADAEGQEIPCAG